MSILDMFKNKQTVETEQDSKTTEAKASEEQAQAKPKHGEDGVCCGGCH
ncbi:CCGSCS motif protein [Thalassomonas sp. M1454]|nr:CCGSCS motif protein [Thalassomonas sp. M1454]TRX55862.1 CCGSCS motif protein [Thalassomonas sp. M1454]